MFVTYEYEGDFYQVVHRKKLSVKNPITKQWDDAVMYHPLKNPSEFFVLTAKEFDTKFKAIKNEKN